MDPQTQAERNAECRRMVREFLASRSAVADPVSTIHYRLTRPGTGGDWTRDEVTAACGFLVSIGQAVIIDQELGAIPHYQITAAGTLAHEGGRL